MSLKKGRVSSLPNYKLMTTLGKIAEQYEIYQSEIDPRSEFKSNWA